LLSNLFKCWIKRKIIKLIFPFQMISESVRCIVLIFFIFLFTSLLRMVCLCVCERICVSGRERERERKSECVFMGVFPVQCVCVCVWKWERVHARTHTQNKNNNGSELSGHCQRREKGERKDGNKGKNDDEMRESCAENMCDFNSFSTMFCYKFKGL